MIDIANENSYFYISFSFMSKIWTKNYLHEVCLRVQSTCLDAQSFRGFIVPLSNRKIWVLEKVKDTYHFCLLTEIELLLDIIRNYEVTRGQEIDIPIKDIVWVRGETPFFAQTVQKFGNANISFVRISLSCNMNNS
jgi:hypothetical protein